MHGCPVLEGTCFGCKHADARIEAPGRTMQLAREHPVATMYVVELGARQIQGAALTSNYLKVDLSRPREANRIVDVTIAGVTDGGVREAGVRSVLPIVA